MSYSYQDNYLKLYPSDNKQVKKCHERTKEILGYYFKTSPNSQNYKLIHPINLSEYDNLAKIAKNIISRFRQIVIVGMGGSSLNPKMTTSLGYKKSHMSIKYLDTTDPLYYRKIMQDLDLSNTYFLIISKSGKTLEVLSLLGAIINDFNQQQITDYSKNFCIITGKEDNTLRRIADNIGAFILDHDENIGGRFATFTNVGILPGLLAGYNMIDFIEGANSVIKSLWEDKENSSPVKAATSLLLFAKPILVNIGYLKIFSNYLNWYNQIISESLGKNGKGFTPVKNLGPMDQHSMFQLYIDGPTDKVYGFIYATNQNITDNIIVENMPTLESYYFTNKTLNQINDIQFSSSSAYFDETQPTRKIILDQLNERNLGILAMHSIIEVIILGHLMQIDPFTQPSVEKIKPKVPEVL